MRYLVDTHLLLWAALSPDRLPPEAARLLGDAANDVVFSAATIWEVVIKAGLGRADFTCDPHVLRRGLLDNGYSALPITVEHMLAVSGLPPHHKDPFDRILVAQATVEGITLLTADERLAGYPGPILKL